MASVLSLLMFPMLVVARVGVIAWKRIRTQCGRRFALVDYGWVSNSLWLRWRDVGKAAGARDLAAGRRPRCRCSAFAHTCIKQLVRLEMGRVMAWSKCGVILPR